MTFTLVGVARMSISGCLPLYRISSCRSDVSGARSAVSRSCQAGITGDLPDTQRSFRLEGRCFIAARRERNDGTLYLSPDASQRQYSGLSSPTNDANWNDHVRGRSRSAKNIPSTDRFQVVSPDFPSAIEAPDRHSSSTLLTSAARHAHHIRIFLRGT